jgi:uncharacterized protein (TIGR03437 family)
MDIVTRLASLSLILLRSLILLSAASAVAQMSAFPLGVGYSEWLNDYSTQIATDSSGAIYLLQPYCSNTASSCVTKLSADGSTMLWDNAVGFSVNAMAVDPTGGVYVIPQSQPQDASIYVAKLAAGGTGLAWKVAVGLMPGGPSAIAADSQGRAYVAAASGPIAAGVVVRVNATGSGVDYSTQLTGTPTAIAVDSSGAAFIAGFTTGTAGSITSQNSNTGFLTRVLPDGSTGFSVTLPQNSQPAAVAVNTSGNAVVLGSNGVLQRVDSSGTVTLVTAVAGMADGGLALDAAGNAYIAGQGNQAFQMKNSLATCGNTPLGVDFLTVVAPDGSQLQGTYFPGVISPPNPLMPAVATGSNSTVLVLVLAGASYVPTRGGPFAGDNSATSYLLNLSSNANAQVPPLACLGNGASFQPVAISPGEMVTLFGTGLGPEQGVQPQATLEGPYPTQASGVEVTFDGKPAPLLWVQDGQINTVAPWSLTPGQNTQVCVSYHNANANCLTWAVTQAAAGVFTVDGTYALAINQDGSLNSAKNPAAVGTIVTVWATGLGPIMPAQADGALVLLPLPNNVYAISVGASDTVGENCLLACNWQPFTVEYAGPAPYLVAGATQINFQATNYLGAIYVTTLQGWSQGFQIYVAGQ